MSVKLEKSIAKIREVLQEMKLQGIKVNEDKKGGLSESAIKSYGDTMVAMIKTVYQEFGISEITKVKDNHVKELVQERINNYHKGNLKEANNVNSLISAIRVFQKGVETTDVFKKPFKMIENTNELREMCKENYIFRKSAASPVMRATPDQCKNVLQTIKETGYNTKIREMAYYVGRIQHESGGRIKDVLKLKVGDMEFENNRMVFKNSKGGLTRNVSELNLSKETVDYVKKLSEGKKPGTPIFGVKKRDGTFRSADSIANSVSKIVSKAAGDIGLKEEVKVKVKDQNGEKKEVSVTRKFSTHSFRKSFALERTHFYFEKFHTKSSLDRYVSKRVKENDVIKKKLDTARLRINKDRNEKRDLTREEYSIFFTSVDLGHFRTDVITSFYTTFKEVESYYYN